jgi:hypothetical protein
MRNIPNQIFLQTEVEYHTENVDFNDLDGVSWNSEGIHKSDLPYNLAPGPHLQIEQVDTHYIDNELIHVDTYFKDQETGMTAAWIDIHSGKVIYKDQIFASVDPITDVVNLLITKITTKELFFEVITKNDSHTISLYSDEQKEILLVDSIPIECPDLVEDELKIWFRYHKDPKWMMYDRYELFEFANHE